MIQTFFCMPVLKKVFQNGRKAWNLITLTEKQAFKRQSQQLHSFYGEEMSQRLFLYAFHFPYSTPADSSG